MPDFGQNIATRRAAALARLEVLIQAVEAVEVPSAARALIYDRKAKEARALNAGDPGPFPLLDVDAAVEGITQQAAADAILAEDARMSLLSAVTEGFRRRIKTALLAATSVGDVDAAAAGITLAALQAELSGIQ